MKNTYTTIAMLAGLLGSLLPQVSLAQGLSTATINSQDSILVYYYDFDDLALDFTLHTNAGNHLRALTVSGQGTARPGIEFHTLTLWADRGVVGFQGWGYDQKLGDAVRTEDGNWVFAPLNYIFANPDQRFFISLDSGSLIQDKTFQLALMEAMDMNADHQYQAGDLGIYLDEGPISPIPQPPYSHTVLFRDQKSDFQGPKAYIANAAIDPANPTIVVPGMPFTFTGEAKDRNGGVVQTMWLVVNNQNIPVQSTQTGYATWQASYTPSSGETNLQVHVVASDGSHEFTSEAYYLVVQAPQPAPSPAPTPTPTPESIPTPEQPGTLHDGDLIKGSLSAVYYYSRAGQRHVFVNAEIYASWYGTDFSQVKTISDAKLATVTMGKPVPFKPGTMIKVPSVPAVYVVDLHQTLRHIVSEQIAAGIFGPLWNKKIHDLSEALLFTYNFGADVVSTNDFQPNLVSNQSLTIDSELGL
jgi:hypothetical protein